MPRFEPLLSARFNAALPDLPRVGRTLTEGTLLYGPTVKTLGCVEDWRGGFVLIAPADRPCVCLVPYARVVDLTSGMEPSRGEREFDADAFAAAGRSRFSAIAATFSVDIPEITVSGRPIAAGTTVGAEDVRELSFDRDLRAAVSFSLPESDTRYTVPLEAIALLVFQTPEARP